MGKMSNLCKDFWHNFHDLKNNVESHTGVLTGVGIATGILGTVLACKATLKMANKAEEHKKLVDDTKESCAEMEFSEKETHKEVMRTYRHIGMDYAKAFLPAIGVTLAAYGLIIKAHNIEVAKNEALMSAYIGLEQFLNKYRARVAEQVGEEREKEIYKQAQVDQAEENTIGKYAGPFRNGSYLLFNESCRDYQEGCPQANDYLIGVIEQELNMKYATFTPVYLNDVMRACGHEEVNGGWDWVKAKGLTDGIDFKIHDKDFNPEFAKGYGFVKGQEPIAKLYLNGFVHVSQLYSTEYRQYLRKEKADGGIMGGQIGKDEVIIG